MNYRSNGLTSNSLFSTTLLNTNTSYFIQEWNIPGIIVNHPVENTRVGVLNFQGNIAEYNPLDLKIVVDENLTVWKDIVKVFQTYQIPGTNTCEPLVGESFIEVFDSKNKYLFKITFHNCYFKSMGDLRYSSVEENEVLSIDLSVVYDYYTIE